MSQLRWPHRIPTTASIAELANWRRWVVTDPTVWSFTSSKATYTIERLIEEGGRWLLAWGVPDAVRLAKVGIYDDIYRAVEAAAEHHREIDQKIRDLVQWR